MLPAVAADDGARTRFLRETEYAQALKHRHAVELRATGCSDGIFFFTMEYCDGGSVGQLLKQRGGPPPIDEAAHIICQVLVGLDYAHHADIAFPLPDGRVEQAKGLVHRDLSPQNVFLAGSGSGRVAKVGDYGLAKAFDLAGLSGQTRTGSVAGKPYFLPRQQVVNFKYVKPEVDVWAPAASFYVMLTGQAPRDFPEGKDPWQVVLQTSAVPIRQRDAAVPKKLAEVIDQALIDKPAIAFKSAAEFARALTAAL
jgi:serine/threonine protein kinase